MDSVDEIMQLCRLCLVKDEVNIPIFEEQGDLRQIFLKISACLPVKVSKEDNLPKNICDGCSCKLETLYQFWNTSANSEKKLMKWLSQVDKPVSDKHSMNIDPVILKQEVVEVPDDRHSPDDDLVPDDLNVSNDAEDYLIQQQQLPYQNVEFQFQQDEFDQTGTDANVVETGPPSRKRRAAAIRAMANMGSEDEDNPDLLEPKIAKTEEESEESCNEDPEPTTFVGLPSSNDNEQPGPSGVGKPAADAPCYSLRSNPNVTFRRYQGIRCVRKFPKNNKKIIFKCDMCEKEFNKKQLLKYHQARHAQNYKVKCDQCDKGFYTMLEFKRHYAVRHKGVRFVCDHCDKSFLDQSWFKRHVKTHDSNYVRIEHKCLECGKIYNSRGGLNVHMRQHKNRCFICHICGKSVTSKTSLKHHIMLHTGEKPFICEVCGKCFNKKMLLRIHERIHTKVKPYSCTECEKSFSQRSTLTIHMRYHTGNRPYQCNVCQKKFVTKTLLKMHLKIHGST